MRPLPADTGKGRCAANIIHDEAKRVFPEERRLFVPDGTMLAETERRIKLYNAVKIKERCSHENRCGSCRPAGRPRCPDDVDSLARMSGNVIKPLV